MTDTEKILNLLEINENIPALVIDEESSIISGNFSWSKLFHSHESGKSFYKYFDKNASLLIKNSVLDAKTFLKTQRRDINIEVDEISRNFNLLISPFQLDKKLYCYILLIDNNPIEELHVYPTLDIKSVTSKYNKIIEMLKQSLPKSLVEKKNFQYEIDIENEPIAIKDNVQYLFTNKSFNYRYKLSDLSNTLITSESIFPKNLLAKIKLAENEIYSTKSAFVIEEKIVKDSVSQLNNRILLLPILNKENIVESIMIIGSIKSENEIPETLQETKDTEFSEIDKSDIHEIDNAAEAKIIYDRNNFDIIEANFIAAKLYGYDLEVFKELNITELFPPEEMQKLLMYSEEKGNYIFNQLQRDGSIISVNVYRENIKWEDREACLETITLNQPEEEVIDLKEDEDEKQSNIQEKEVTAKADEEIKSESKSEFLSSLFHEILTPVNVILGFVQEIIDSLDSPTEEQKESAQIIKDNQQMLLQTMNTAAQFAQLDENKIKLKIEEFNFNKYMVDLNDSYSRDAEKANIKIVLDDIPDSLVLRHDRSKLLASISYLVKFVLKLTKSSKIYLSLKVIDEKLYFLIKDSEKGIAENVASDLLEIFNNQQFSKKKNYGISPISIKLANLLNKLLSVTIKEFTHSNGIKTIALVTTMNFEKSKETLAPETEQIKIPLTEEVHESTEEEILPETDTENYDAIEDEIEIESDITSEIEQDIPVGEVDDKIVEDIEDEEEIVTEEIATVEESEEKITPQEIIDQDAESSNLADLSCLFIDDSVDAQLLFKSQMNDFKQLKVSPNLTEALPLLSKYNFDLVVVDIHLNDKYNGLDALKIIRQFNSYKDIPIFAITAYPFEKDREKFLSFGFTDYFVKPLLKEQLIDSLLKILS